MTLDVTEKLSREFKALAKHRRAVGGRIDPAPPSTKPITCGKRLSTKETVNMLVTEISEMRGVGLTWPEITRAFNARYRSKIEFTTMQQYHQAAIRRRKKETSHERE